MRSRGPAIAILIALAAHAGLAAHRLGFLPETARVLIAALVLLLVPGFAWMRLLGASPPGGATLASGWALGFGVAWNALLLSVTAIARVPFTSLTVATVPLNALLWVIAVRRRGAARDQTPLGGTSRVFVLLAALAGAALALRLGAAMTNLTDSPDHIGTIRRMLEHGTLFPTDAFYRDAGAAGIDPRKFLWHGDAAVITRLAAVEPWVAWRDLPILLTPLLILNVAGFGARIAGGAGAAIAAWVLFLTYGGSPAGTALRETVFAAKLADQLALAATVALLVVPARGRLRRALRRPARARPRALGRRAAARRHGARGGRRDGAVRALAGAANATCGESDPHRAAGPAHALGSRARGVAGSPVGLDGDGMAPDPAARAASVARRDGRVARRRAGSRRR